MTTFSGILVSSDSCLWAGKRWKLPGRLRSDSLLLMLLAIQLTYCYDFGCLLTVFSRMSTLVARGGMPSPLLPLSTPASVVNLTPALPSFRGCSTSWGNNDCTAPGWRQQPQDTCLTATPSAAGRTLPPLRSVTSRLLELNQECMTTVAGQGSCMMLVAEWRDCPSSAKYHLLHLSLPHVNPVNASLDPGR